MDPMAQLRGYLCQPSTGNWYLILNLLERKNWHTNEEHRVAIGYARHHLQEWYYKFKVCKGNWNELKNMPRYVQDFCTSITFQNCNCRASHLTQLTYAFPRTEIRELRIKGNMESFEKTSCRLRVEFPLLEVLEIRYSATSTRTMGHLQWLTSLRELYLPIDHMTGYEFDRIGKICELPDLEHLRISAISPRQLNTLSGCKNLKSIEVLNLEPYTNADIIEILDRFPSLASASISSNQSLHVSSDKINELQRKRPYFKLNINGNVVMV